MVYRPDQRRTLFAVYCAGRWTLQDAIDIGLDSKVNLGPANPREFAEVTSTTEALAPLAHATGGDARRLSEQAGGSIDVPRVVAVRSSDNFREGWIGLKMRQASVVRGVGVLPVFAGLLGLVLLLGSLAAAWAREGR